MFLRKLQILVLVGLVFVSFSFTAFTQNAQNPADVTAPDSIAVQPDSIPVQPQPQQPQSQSNLSTNDTSASNNFSKPVNNSANNPSLSESVELADGNTNSNENNVTQNFINDNNVNTGEAVRTGGFSYNFALFGLIVLLSFYFFVFKKRVSVAKF